MLRSNRMEPVDYVAIGHITLDDTPEGPRIGGSAAYAALTAQAFGLRAGIVTAWGEELPADALAGVAIHNIGAQHSTRFENSYVDGARTQRISQLAPELDYYYIPEAWRSTPIVHLAPVAQEVSPRILSYFSDSTRCATPQGWLREWDADGRIQPADWLEAELTLSRLDACILGLEDVGGDLTRVDSMAALCPVLVVTDGKAGAHLYSQGEITHIPAVPADEVDPTGAGDVFAATFFLQLHRSGDAHLAGHLAARVAAHAVTRVGLAGIPTRDELFDLLAEAAA
ncbi:MAG TPA: PfkB family carbohydrate kinase [Anaerolineales bacterium]|nr:PfkB family carbohydrate kinase [Anaerolineales bacterium]HRQ92065.1 PfkB family carbohydrate kinase [Anaerolineales bacterium]